MAQERARTLLMIERLRRRLECLRGWRAAVGKTRVLEGEGRDYTETR
jgi:hypothetical protein